MRFLFALLFCSSCFGEVRTIDGGKPHWVGNGFYVTPYFPSQSIGYQESSPFVLLDYMPPSDYPKGQKLGVGMHPHRGFETVTIVYEGEVSHKDSTGAGGKVGPGEVQWMTAGSGVLHEEYHSGGKLHAIQLWVNLPKAKKGMAPRYQTLQNIPKVSLDQRGSYGRVIAGNFHGVKGPAITQTPIDLIDIHLERGATALLPLKKGDHTLILPEKGPLLFIQNESEYLLTSSALVMSGEPIDEPIVHSGPFVMNTQEEIEQARRDFFR